MTKLRKSKEGSEGGEAGERAKSEEKATKKWILPLGLNENADRCSAMQSDFSSHSNLYGEGSHFAWQRIPLHHRPPDQPETQRPSDSGGTLALLLAHIQTQVSPDFSAEFHPLIAQLQATGAREASRVQRRDAGCRSKHVHAEAQRQRQPVPPPPVSSLRFSSALSGCCYLSRNLPRT